MRISFCIGLSLVSMFILVLLGAMLYALPATASLPRGKRSGIEDLTIEEAAARIRRSGNSGKELMEQARLLVGERMQYCRRNSFDLHRKAFRRGYGYCQQEAHALAELLKELGFEAWPVHCEHCSFSHIEDTGHAWVRVYCRGAVLDVDSKYIDVITGQHFFQYHGRVKKYTPLFRLFAGWGSIAANARRYYQTGDDTGIWHQVKVYSR